MHNFYYRNIFLSRLFPFYPFAMKNKNQFKTVKNVLELLLLSSVSEMSNMFQKSIGIFAE